METKNTYTKGDIARIHLLDAPYSIDHPYDYFVPSDLRDFVQAGSFVTVPFGNGNRKQIALVTSLPEKTDFDNLKPVAGLCSAGLSLDADMMELCFYMKEQTLCTVGDAVRCMIPSAALSKLVEYYRPVSEKSLSSAGGMSPAELFVYEFIVTRGSVSSDSLKAKFGAKVLDTVNDFCKKGIIVREFEIKDSQGEKFRTVYSVGVSHDIYSALLRGESASGLKLTSKKQVNLIEFLLENPGASEEEICNGCGVGKTCIKTLTDKGIISAERIYESQTKPAKVGKRTDIDLNPGQNEAYRTLEALSDSGEPKAALLHGITGSGKTCVMLRFIDHLLERGKSVIVLLPEIALTPQSLDIFCSRYGELVAVIHSGLSAGERMESFKAAESGHARVIIGTRSAVFSPVRNLGAIIIDEEQEHTYKSDQNPKYHARDIARFRCAHSNALMLLASATPSLESYTKAKEGKYTLIKLTERYGNAKLPEVTVADMRGETQSGNITPLGSLLSRDLIDTFEKKQQSVLFLNRRGYNHLISCRSCGAAVTCPKCSVAMNYHTKRGTYDDGELVCHWCGTRLPVPSACPTCKSTHLMRMGFGTQRVEQELSELVKGANILRMDADTTATKSSHDKILSEFRRHKADILLGTQMVTKGHDFPDVTLVGVLLADASLYLDDYRANEQTFALLTQVIGRAGRADKPGHAIIQTNNPDSDVIKLACAQDYETFYEREIKLRKLLIFPPFCDIAMLTLISGDEKELMINSTRLAEEINVLSRTEYSDVAMIVFGPFEAPVYRVDNKYRMRMIIKCRLNRRSRELFSQLLIKFGKDPKKITLAVDFNPSSLS